VSGTPTANLLTGLQIDEYFTRTDAAGARHLLTDALASSIALTDGSGAVQTEYTYEPFGSVTTSGATSGNTFGFTGREADGTGLNFYRARYYDPARVRFTGQDPIGFQAGPNVYSYVLNSPLDFTDPLGLDVTVCYYSDAAWPFGHVGFGLPGESGTMGYYQDGIKADQQKKKTCVTLTSSEDQDSCMQRCRENRQKNPGEYSLFGRQCTSFVRDCLNACGVPPGKYNGPKPKPFYDGLLPPSPQKAKK